MLYFHFKFIIVFNKDIQLNIATASNQILGRPRGTPIRTSLSNLRTRPKTVSSNVNVEKVGIRQGSYSGQIIPRPKNDGLGPSNSIDGGNYRNEITVGGSLPAENNLPKRGRGSSTLSTSPLTKSRQASQQLDSKNSKSNSAFLSRFVLY